MLPKLAIVMKLTWILLRAIHSASALTRSSGKLRTLLLVFEPQSQNEQVYGQPRSISHGIPIGRIFASRRSRAIRSSK